MPLLVRRCRRYGQRALVNENVGSLVNTLTLYQHTDLRLEAFARQLSEEWDVSIFLDFLIAQNLCLQVGRPLQAGTAATSGRYMHQQHSAGRVASSWHQGVVSKTLVLHSSDSS